MPCFTDVVWGCLDEWVKEMASEDLRMFSLLLFEFRCREASATVMNTATGISKAIHKDYLLKSNS